MFLLVMSVHRCVNGGGGGEGHHHTGGLHTCTPFYTDPTRDPYSNLPLNRTPHIVGLLTVTPPNSDPPYVRVPYRDPPKLYHG